MISKGIQDVFQKLLPKKKNTKKSIFVISKYKNHDYNILNLDKNIIPTHKKHPTNILNSSNAFIYEDDKNKEMEIESDKKESSNNSMIMKSKSGFKKIHLGNDSFYTTDKSSGENYSSENSNYGIEKKTIISQNINLKYSEISKKSEEKISFEIKEKEVESYSDPNFSFVDDYIDEILENLKIEEANNEFKIDPDYFHFQTEINSKMRIILIDWILEVTNKLKFKENTFFITTYIIDAYLSKKFIPRKKFQLLGVTALYISTKLNEIFSGKAKDYAFITDNAFNEKEILDMETDIAKTIEFNFLVPNSLSFFEIILNKFDIDKDLSKSHLGKFLIKCFLMSSKSFNYNYSTISIATFYLIMEILENDHNKSHINFNLFCNDNLNIIEECSENIIYVIQDMAKSNLNLSIKNYYYDNFDEKTRNLISSFKN